MYKIDKVSVVVLCSITRRRTAVLPNATLSEIAKKLGLSRSTVSKTFHHCSGVDFETRQLVLDAIRDANLKFTDFKPIHAVLPDTPAYFWKTMRQGLLAASKESGTPFGFSIYTNPVNFQTVLEYLREAEEAEIRVLILSAYMTPEIYGILQRMVRRCCVILLTEQYDLNSSFYVGSDAYRDGREMGKLYLAEYSDYALYIIDYPWYLLNNELRLKGFLDAVREAKPELAEQAVLLKTGNDIDNSTKAYAAYLARTLSEAVRKDTPCCFYAPTGMSQLPDAIRKSGLDAVCIGHDSAFSNNQLTEYNASCNQDTFRQGYTAGEAAVRFLKSGQVPPQKNLYIPSIIKGSQ
ncbi:MAG: LacI family DNA-binding transcriptional regulator [Clostridia bacterium]|nr:LacI family DNA-binding transcriptional regulator [Clostridia bacterium]